MNAPFRILHPDDNVAVALGDVATGAAVSVDGCKFVVQEAIPAGHKVAVRALAPGDEVIKYGYPIGEATAAIAPGAHVHVSNARTRLGNEGKLAVALAQRTPRAIPRPERTGFLGYRRTDGRVAIRNEIWIINTVACVNVASQRIAELARAEFVRPGGPIDGVYALTHPFGCSQLGDDLGHTRDLLVSLALHPHAAGVLVLGLGCENNHLRAFLGQMGADTADRVRFFNAQEVGDEIERGLEEVRALAALASTARREWIPASELIVAMKCGGSDGFSGITANPLVGRVGDILAGCGGTVLLSEVPEMFGAEEALFSRCEDESVLAGAMAMVEGFKDYYRRHGEPIHENPSPGNKDGGITTLEEKSLGCVQKGGGAPVRAVLPYTGRAKAGLGGITLVEAPGNDGVSCTAMAAAGANLILFTTGRGTPLGVPVPTLKIASHSGLAARKPGWIDFDAGILAGEEAPSLDEVALALWDRVLDTADGRETRNEINGFREITIWKQGVTL